jgi:DNA-binding response OmpR family regulator
VATERLRILAVEDEALIAMELEDMLVDLGHEVIGPASTVETALALVRQAPPQAAIVDANLGGESARPVCEALAKAGIPVVIASGYAARELSNLDISGVQVQKPYSRRDLETALAEVMRLPSRPHF